MGYTKNKEKDEIDAVAANDSKQRTFIEAHALASRPMADLLRSMLRSRKQAFEFNGIAKKTGYMEVKDQQGNNTYIITLGIVPRNYMFNMDELKDAKNYDAITGHMSKFFLYCETIFKLLKIHIQEEFDEIESWELKIDKNNSTVYIDSKHPKRIGFVITKKSDLTKPSNHPHENQETSETSETSEPLETQKLHEIQEINETSENQKNQETREDAVDSYILSDPLPNYSADTTDNPPELENAHDD